MKTPELGFELYQWLVDTVDNIKSRVFGWMLMMQARIIVKDIERYAEEEGVPRPSAKNHFGDAGAKAQPRHTDDGGVRPHSTVGKASHTADEVSAPIPAPHALPT